jgi:signal transduction histidine kinase
MWAVRPMNEKLHKLGEEYQSALQNYLSGQGEAALQRAYELGRKAMAEEIGVLEVAAFYHDALPRILNGRSDSGGSAKLLRLASEFFSESLSAFEMAYRGYREANARLRLLSERLQSAREEERIRIARDIHDELGQALTCLKIDLSWLHRRLRVNADSRNDRTARPLSLREKTKAMLKSIDGTMDAVGRISAELRPALLDDLGLLAAIEWQVQEFQKRTGIRCGLTLPSRNPVLEPGRSTALFRICQEILTNVARHSKATRVRILLKRERSGMVLKVQDNGRGITRDEISDRGSIGLLGIRERALFWGGEVRIRGIPGRGTRVAVKIPITQAP